MKIVPAVKFPSPTVDPAFACQLSENLRAIMQAQVDDHQARIDRQAETRQRNGNEFLQMATRMLLQRRRRRIG